MIEKLANDGFDVKFVVSNWSNTYEARRVSVPNLHSEEIEHVPAHRAGTRASSFLHTNAETVEK